MSADDLEREPPRAPDPSPDGAGGVGPSEPRRRKLPLSRPAGASGSPPICKWLRAKTAGPHGAPESLERLRGDRSAVFWCLLTQGPAGPDDGLAHLDLCHAERRCVEELPPA